MCHTEGLAAMIPGPAQLSGEYQGMCRPDHLTVGELQSGVHVRPYSSERSSGHVTAQSPGAALGTVVYVC